MRKIGREFGDSASDSRANFNFAMGIGPEPVIRQSMNVTSRSSVSYVRTHVMREFLSDPRAWRRKHGYELRRLM